MSPIRTRQFIPALLLMAALVSSVTAAPSGQTTPAPQPKPSPATADTKPLGQVRVQVTITRYTAEKKTASLPFTLWANLNGETTSLNAGQHVAVPSTSVVLTSGEDKAAVKVPYSMQSVGTRITCSAKPSTDGRLLMTLYVQDTYLTPAKADGGLATVKSLSTTNNLLLRDGQTAEFVTSTDMVSGEVTRIDVTVTTLK